MTTESRSTFTVPAREIPVPSSISAEAQAALAAGSVDTGNSGGWPSPDDTAAWHRLIAAADEALLAGLLARVDGLAVDITEIDLDNARVYVATPAGYANDQPVVLDMHGGGMIMGGGANCRAATMRSADRLGTQVWGVDYRMPPNHPYPAGLDDCLATYQRLLTEHDPAQIVVAGASAGGNLAAALILRARDAGVPLPGAALLMTPEVDLTESGDSFRTNLGVDTVLRPMMPVNLLYAAGADLTHPYLSPLFGDFVPGFPPTLLTTGTRDLFLSNTVRMHRALRRAGIAAELHVLEAAPHGAFFGTSPEERELDAEIRRFIESHCGTRRD